MFHHRWALGNALVVHHLCCKRDAGDRSLELVRHIVDKVVLYLGIALLSEDYEYCEDEGNEQHDGESYRRNHKPY